MYSFNLLPKFFHDDSSISYFDAANLASRKAQETWPTQVIFHDPAFCQNHTGILREEIEHMLCIHGIISKSNFWKKIKMQLHMTCFNLNCKMKNCKIFTPSLLLSLESRLCIFSRTVALLNLNDDFNVRASFQRIESQILLLFL